MAEKEKEKETEQFGAKIPVEEEKPSEEKTPTLEEQLVAAKAEKQTLEERATTAEKGLKTAHSRLTDKDKEIRGKNAVNTRIDGLEETIRILAGMQDEKLGDLEEGKKTDYLGKFDDIVKRQKAEREQSLIKAQQDEYSQKADAIFARAEEAFKDDEDSLFQVRTFLMNGADALAEKKVAKAEKTTDTKEKKVESEEERINKLVDEKLRQKMEEKGMLESETGGPSGASPNDEQIRKNFRENPNDSKAYQEYHAYLTRTGQSHK